MNPQPKEIIMKWIMRTESSRVAPIVENALDMKASRVFIAKSANNFSEY